MKTLKIILISICITPAIAFSQNESSKEKKYSITDANVLLGGYFQKSYYTSLSDFRKLVPNSLLLAKNIDHYVPYQNLASTNVFLAPSISIKKYNKEKKKFNNTELRVGIIYYSTSTLSTNLNYTDRKSLDSIPDPKWDHDSVWYNNYSINTNSEQFRLDASVLFRTNQDLRWSLFGGVGAEIGSSLNSEVIISYYQTKGEEYKLDNTISNPPMYYNQNYEYNSSTEIIRTKNQLGAAVYLPMGFDWRTGNKREFFKKLHVFGEVRPFLNMTHVAELNKSYCQAGVRAGLGLRVNL